MTDIGSGREPRLSDDRQWWWTGTEWVRASQPPPAPPGSMSEHPEQITEQMAKQTVGYPARSTGSNVRVDDEERALAFTRERLGMWYWISFVLIVGLVLLPWWAVRTTTVTPQRVVKRAGLIWRRSQAIPLTTIADVNTVFGPLAAAVYLTSAGGPSMTIGPLTHGSARRIVTAIEAARKAVS